ncbi:metallopeptidase TldD-related protein [Halobacteriovorax sp. GB3]|uniref:metallopeptidase TldD-related protein n=1 Tax=Halobacteriovorax sp. GB3 TaxID=2719615 RepID=UPI00236261DA|nr:metallopeptidase TldD-related protein [Halobacteriovorax sp. GB3]MDD0852838.1 metallopeptidase TldD-related protein [Halobacteriovorax sp. GB3]
MMLELNKVKTYLEELNQFLKDSHIEGSLTYRSEVSHLVRAGRSQISLNVEECSTRLYIDLFKVKKKISAVVSNQLDRELDAIKTFIVELYNKIDFMSEVEHLRPMRPIAQGELNQNKYDQTLVNLESAKLVELFSKVRSNFAEEINAGEVDFSGAFSAGVHGYCVINTLVEKAIYYQGSDWNVEVVLQLLKDDKKEIREARVGEFFNEFNSDEIINGLKKTYEIKKETTRLDLEPGEYDIVFSSDAFAEITNYMSWMALSGERFEYQSGMLQKDKHAIGTKVFGDNVTISDDPNDPDILYARPVGLNGVERKFFPLITDGVLSNLFYSDKDSCDRFSLDINNDFSVASIKVHQGDGPETFDQVVKNSKKKTLFIPYIHYMNITNAAKGEFTGTSRFGTLLMENGKITSHLYNLRINDSYHRIFNNIDWLSSKLAHVNTSDTYGMRSSSSITCPSYVKVCSVNITGSSKVKELK